MKYEINGKEATRHEASEYLKRIGYSPYLGREVQRIDYIESEAKKMMYVLCNNSYSYLGLTIRI